MKSAIHLRFGAGHRSSIEHVRSDGGGLPLAQIRRQATPSRTCFEACSRINRSIRCRPHDTPSASVVPHAPGAVGPIARQEARANLRTELFIASGCADCAVVSARHRSHPARHRAPRTTSRRHEIPVLRNETNPHQFLREVGRGFFRMSHSAFSLATSRFRRAISSCSGFIWPCRETHVAVVGEALHPVAQLRGVYIQVLRCLAYDTPRSLIRRTASSLNSRVNSESRRSTSGSIETPQARCLRNRVRARFAIFGVHGVRMLLIDVGDLDSFFKRSTNSYLFLCGSIHFCPAPTCERLPFQALENPRRWHSRASRIGYTNLDARRHRNGDRRTIPPQIAAQCLESSSSEMALYASLTFGLWHNSVEARSSPFQRLLITCADGTSAHDGFLHTFTVLPNNVTSGLYGA